MPRMSSTRGPHAIASAVRLSTSPSKRDGAPAAPRAARWQNVARGGAGSLVGKRVGGGVVARTFRAESRGVSHSHLPAVVAMAASLFLAGCSSGPLAASQTPVAAANRAHVSSLPQPATASTALLYVATSKGTVLVYDQSNQKKGPIQTLDSSNGLRLPFGLFVDSAQNLYVADEENEAIYLFPAGATQPSVTYSDPGEYPDSVARCPDGKMYAGNYAGTTDRYGSVSIYSANAKKPSHVLTSSNFFSVSGVACDSNNNLYVAYYYTDAGPGYVSEYGPGGTGKGTLLPFSVQAPGSLSIDAAGDFVLTDQFSGIDYFHPTSSQPFKTIVDNDLPLGFGLNANDSTMWIGDSNTDTVRKVNAKTGKEISSFTTAGAPVDIAVFPPD
jgi:hypothetical protein